jgi:hypothetical protein
MSEIVASVASVTLLVLGLSFLLQPPMWVSYLRVFTADPHRAVPLNLMMLVLGLLIVAAHSEWEGWAVVVTVLGWVMVAKGAVNLLFPQILKLPAGISDASLRTYLRIVGLITAAIASVVVYDAVLK